MNDIIINKTQSLQRCIARAREENELDDGDLSSDLSRRLQSMVGFRNIAVHDYRQLDMDILKWVIDEGLNDFLSVTDEVRRVLDSQET